MLQLKLCPFLHFLSSQVLRVQHLFLSSTFKDAEVSKLSMRCCERSHDSRTRA